MATYYELTKNYGLKYAFMCWLSEIAWRFCSFDTQVKINNKINEMRGL